MRILLLGFVMLLGVGKQARPHQAQGSVLPADIVPVQSFEDGTLGSYLVIGTGDTTNVQVVAENPLEGLNAVRFHYVISAASVGNQDSNRDVEYRFPAPWNTQEHIFYGGAVRRGPPLNTTASVQRKLMYLMADRTNNADWFLIVGGFDNPNGLFYLNLAALNPVSLSNFTLAPAFILQQDTYYGLEVEVQPNTPGLADGTIRLWVYDAAFQNELHRQTWPNVQIRSTTRKIEKQGFGYQCNRINTGEAVDEYRYWDKIVISTRRIGNQTTLTIPTPLPVGSNISFCQSASVPGQGLAPNNTTIAASSKIAYKARIKGYTLVDLLTGGFSVDLFETYEAGADVKLAAYLTNNSGNFSLKLLTPAYGFDTASATYPCASINRDAYYRIYFHCDASQATDKVHYSLYADDGTPLIDSSYNHNLLMVTTAGRGAFAIGKNVYQSYQKVPMTFDWVAIYTDALAGAARYSTPTASDASLASGWDFNEGLGTSVVNIVPGAETLSLSFTGYNWL